jgi:GntP family gluconate:H+ symporter
MPAGVSGTQLILGLVIGIAVLVFLILKTKVHAFTGLIFAAAVTGLIAGLAPTKVAASIVAGFGSTLGSIGIVIGFGVMMGQALEVSGAAERMALTFIKLFGRGHEEWAMAATGYVVSIPIFCDSGYVILSPLAKALSRRTKKSGTTLGIALAIGLVATHHAVPPTPGPLGVAGIFKVDVGLMILYGLVFALPVVIAGVLYAQWWGKKHYITPDENGNYQQGTYNPADAKKAEKLEASTAFDRKLPSAFMAFLPLVLPIILILANTILSAIYPAANPQPLWAQYLIFLGNPVIAVGIGLVVALYGLMGDRPQKDTLKELEKGMASAGIIILVTGAGGSLGQVMRDTGVGNYVAQAIAATRIPPILLPFIVASLVRLVQGSGTVGMMTAASITAPILAPLNVNPVLAAQACALGAMVFSYFNDSYFWVVNRMLGIEDVKDQIMTWSVPTTIGWGISLVMLLVASFIIR